MPLPMGETIKAKAEEIRGKIQTRIGEIRGGSSGGILGNPGILGGNPGVLKSPIVSEIKTKGLMATVRSRFEKFRAGGAGTESGPSPAGVTPPVMSEKDFKVRGSRVML